MSEAALAFLGEQGVNSLTVTDTVISNCGGGSLVPEVTPGPPRDPEGFQQLTAGAVTVYYDSLLPPRLELRIDLAVFPHHRELQVVGWEL